MTSKSACGSFLSSFFLIYHARVEYVVVRGAFLLCRRCKKCDRSVSVADETIMSIRLEGNPTLCRQSVQFKSHFDASPVTVLHLDLTNTTSVTLMWINF